MKNFLAASFVGLFLVACGTHAYKNTHAERGFLLRKFDDSHRGSLLEQPDYMADHWRARLKGRE